MAPPRRCRMFWITNGVLDARKVVEGFFVPREKWFQFVDDQLVGQDGGKLYAQTAVEWRVVDGMRRIVDFTQNCFRVKGTYPSNSDRWNAQPISKWVNPLTGRAEPIRLQAISLDVGLPHIFGSAENLQKRSNSWAPAHPGWMRQKLIHVRLSV